MEKRLLTMREAATYMGIPENSLRSRISTGNFPVIPIKIGERTIRFDIGDIDKYIEDQKGGHGNGENNEG